MQPVTSKPDLALDEIALPRNAWYSPASFEVASWLIRHLPPSAGRALAAAVGRLGFEWCDTRREAVLWNLTALSHDPAVQHRLAQGCFENFLRMLHDFIDCAGGGVGRINQLVVDRRGFEFLEAGRKGGRGILLVTGHLGAWELGGMVLAADGFPVNVVTLAEPTPELNTWRQKYRARFAIKTITVGSDKFAFVEIIQALRRNELVAMLIDRPYLNSGVPVRFFERPTFFSAAAARIWSHTRAAIVPAFVLQLTPGRYGCYAYPSIDLESDDTIEESSQKMANVFQAIIREFPDQWFNFVPVWKTKANHDV